MSQIRSYVVPSGYAIVVVSAVATIATVVFGVSQDQVVMYGEIAVQWLTALAMIIARGLEVYKKYGETIESLEVEPVDEFRAFISEVWR